MKRTITTLLVLAFLVVGALGVIAAAGPDTVTLKAKNGDVTFSHKAHAGMMECSACHEGTPGKMTPMGRDAGHKLCLDCHKAKGAGPTKCGECHKK